MAYRTDNNQAEIVQALRDVGASVAVLAGLGRGVPDLLVGWQGLNLLLEVKNLEGRGKRLTPDESTWHEAWRGQAAIVQDIPGALSVLGGWVSHD